MKIDFKGFFKKPMAVISIVLSVGLVFTGISFKKTVYIDVDGSTTKVTTYKGKVEDVISDIDIKLGTEDSVKPKLNSEIKNGQTIKIKRAVSLDLIVDGKTVVIKSAADSVKDLIESKSMSKKLQSEKISAIREQDKIEPTLDTKITANMKVIIKRIERKNEVTQAEIPFSTEKVVDENMYKGDKEKVVVAGKAGIKEVTTEVTTEDGNVIATSVIGEKVIEEPTNEKIAYGTKEKVVPTVNVPSRGGNIPYKSKMTMKSTAYSSSDKGVSGITASGMKATRDPNGTSTVAVDPRVIPLGTKLYIEGYGYAIACDTGSAIKGNKVDVYFNSVKECYSWGSRNVDVYILE